MTIKRLHAGLTPQVAILTGLFGRHRRERSHRGRGRQTCQILGLIDGYLAGRADKDRMHVDLNADIKDFAAMNGVNGYRRHTARAMKQNSHRSTK
jgi:hypothetical protein